MRLSRRGFGFGVAAAALAPALASAQSDLDKQLTAYLDAAFEQDLAADPERLTRLGRKTLNDQLTDRSDAALAKRLAWRKQSVAEMKRRFDPKKLGEDARTSFEMWELELARAEEANRWRGHSYVFGRGGPHAGLPNFLINAHRVDTPADMQAYVARVAAIGPALDVQLERAKRSAAAGVRAPRFAYEQSLDEVGRLMTGAPFAGEGETALFADAKTKIGKLKASGKIDDAQAAAFEQAVADAMTVKMKPAYDRLAAWLKTDVAHTSPEPKGAVSLPNGVAYYNAMLRQQTTTGMTADEIHALGLAEVKRIRGEMETLKAKIGFKGTLEEFFVFMRTDDRFYVSDDDAGRAQYLKLAEGYLAAMKAELPKYFGRLPKSDLIVKRVESFREEPGGAAHYSSGAPDGSRPGTFYVHLADIRATPTYEIEGTCYHEGWPGHHMQISLAQEMTGVPVFRTQTGYGAYVEGWGLYVELLAKEAGFYQDAYSDFGRLGREIWRAIRLVVDTGIHHKRWTRDQATAYMVGATGYTHGRVQREIDRYCVWPGQALSYKVGHTQWARLREGAKAKLGSKFDIRQFHDAALLSGPMPLTVLEKQIDAYVARTKA